MEAQKIAKPALSAKGQERAESLMAAAIDLFSERDFSSVTIDEMTRRAGVAHSLVYYHFKSKEDLFNRSVTNLIGQTIESYRTIHIRHHNPVELIEDWFDNNVKLSGTLRKLVKIMFDYSGPTSDSPRVEAAIAAFYREEHQILAENIDKGVRQGLFAPVDPQRVAVFVSTHIDGIFYDSFIREGGVPQAMDDLKWVLWKLLEYDAA